MYLDISWLFDVFQEMSWPENCSYSKRFKRFTYRAATQITRSSVFMDYASSLDYAADQEQTKRSVPLYEKRGWGGVLLSPTCWCSFGVWFGLVLV